LRSSRIALGHGKAQDRSHVDRGGPVALTDGEVRDRVAAEVHAGGIAFRDRRRAVASGHLFDAICVASRAASRDVRRNELTKLSMLCVKAGFEDLALIALVGAIAELEAAGELDDAEASMFDVGNLFARLGNLDEMGYWNQRALDTSLARGHHAHAASASTNLAAIAAQRGDLERAEQLATASLGYLEREPLPHTELVTRSLLVRIAERRERPAEAAIAIARPIFGALRDVPASEELRHEVKVALDSIARRHLAAHPALDGAAWKREHLPELWGGAA
jgi:hypothetical protein